MRKILFGTVLFVLLIFLAGCHHNVGQPINNNLVQKIVITSESDNVTVQRYYDTPDKMRLILLYIRSISGRLQPDVDPQTLPGRTVYITTFNADNTQKAYQQKNDHYFQKDGQWQQINPELGAKLWQLILSVPSDPIPESMLQTVPAP